MAVFKKVGLMAKQGHTDAISMAKKLFPFLKKKGCDVFLPQSVFSDVDFPDKKTLVSDKSFVSSIDLLISLGGDGTLLRSVRMLHGNKVAVVGLKFGGVGFLTEIPRESVEVGLTEILNGNYAIEERLKVKAIVNRKGKETRSYHALNDMVVHTTGLARLSKYRLSFSGSHVIDLKSDGVVIATPTGSTAYSLAAGGPIVQSDLNLMVLTPICAQAMLHHPFVVSADTPIGIDLISSNSKLLLTVDGQDSCELETGDTLHIEKSDERAYLLRLADNHFFKSLGEKLLLLQQV